MDDVDELIGRLRTYSRNAMLSVSIRSDFITTIATIERLRREVIEAEKRGRDAVRPSD